MADEPSVAEPFTSLVDRIYCIFQTTSMMFSQYWMMHGFIRNENNLQNHNEYTYKACRKQHYIASQKRLPRQTCNILVGRKHNLFRQQDWSERNGPLQHPSFMASTVSTSHSFCFLTLGLAYIIVHLLQPCHILLITATDGGVNPLMEMTKMSIRPMKIILS